MQNATPRQLIGRLQSLLKERKHNSETPLQTFIDYIKAEREVFELLLQIPQDPVKSEDHLIAEEIPQDLVKSEDHRIAEEIPQGPIKNEDHRIAEEVRDKMVAAS